MPAADMNTPLVPPVPPVPDPAGPVDRDWKQREAGTAPIEGQPEPADESPVESLGRAVIEPVIGAPAPAPQDAPPPEESSSPPRSGIEP